MVSVELFLKSPQGTRCRIFEEYAKELVKDTPGSDLKIYEFPCPESERLGIKEAPALVIDGDIILENPSKEELAESLDTPMIKDLLEEAIDLCCDTDSCEL